MKCRAARARFQQCGTLLFPCLFQRVILPRSCTLFLHFQGSSTRLSATRIHQGERVGGGRGGLWAVRGGKRQVDLPLEPLLLRDCGPPLEVSWCLCFYSLCLYLSLCDCGYDLVYLCFACGCLRPDAFLLIVIRLCLIPSFVSHA